MCYLFAGSISSQYNTFSMAIGFSLGLSDFQLTDLSKMPSFLRTSAFHGYFNYIVSNLHKPVSRGTRTFYIEHTFMNMARYLNSWSWMIDRWRPSSIWLTRVALLDRIAIARLRSRSTYTFKLSLLSCMNQ